MELQEAVEALLKTRAALRSRDGVTNPSFISENMQRLAQYTGAVEEHLAELEEQLEVDEARKFIAYTKDQGKTVNMAEKLAKEDVAELKGQIAKLRRYVNSSWSLVSTSQSRFNHLSSDFKLGKHAT